MDEREDFYIETREMTEDLGNPGKDHYEKAIGNWFGLCIILGVFAIIQIGISIVFGELAGIITIAMIIIGLVIIVLLLEAS